MIYSMCTKQTSTNNPVMFKLTVGGSGTPTTATTTPPGNTGKSPPAPSGPHVSSTGNVTMQSDGKYVTCTYKQHLNNREQVKKNKI